MEQKLNQIIEGLKNINNSLNSFGPEWITAIIALGSLFVLVLYTHYTRQIAQSTKETMIENLRPIVSCELKSGKNYYKPQKLQEQPGLKYDTRCIVHNHSKYNINVFVNLNLKIDGVLKNIGSTYGGEKPWPLTSFQGINGHFVLSEMCDPENANSITIDLEVNYKSDIGKLYKNPIQHWRFDKKEDVWINEIGLAV